jgi:predicted DNA-binding ribbon-helix-helix protein
MTDNNPHLVSMRYSPPTRPTHPDTAIRKRSVSLGGHRTSVSLEQAFWDELSRIARSRGVSTNSLVAEIDRQRAAGGQPAGNLSSAVRLFVLAELQRSAGVLSEHKAAEGGTN